MRVEPRAFYTVKHEEKAKKFIKKRLRYERFYYFCYEVSLNMSHYKINGRR
jgi:hypothetical protein